MSFRHALLRFTRAMLSTARYSMEVYRMGSKVYGYVRVSTKGQNEERQVIAMRNYGIADEQIVIEKRSGKDFDRPAYDEAITRG